MSTDPERDGLESLRRQLVAATDAAQSAYRDTTRLIRLLNVIGKPSARAELVDGTLTVLSDVFSADVACLAHCDGVRLLISNACGLPEACAAFSTGWPITGAAAEASRSGTSIASHGTGLADDLPDELAQLAIVSRAWIPMSPGRPERGLLILCRSSAVPFTDADLRILDTVAYRLSLSIDAAERQLSVERLARLGPHLGRHLEPDDLLRDAADLFRELTVADFAAVVAIADGRATMQARSGGEPQGPPAGPCPVADLPGWSDALRGDPFVANDVSTERGVADIWDSATKSLLSVPVLRGGVPVALLGASRTLSAPFGDDLREVGMLFASYLAAALTNADLYQAVADGQQRLRLITDSISDMIAVVDREGVFIYASPSYRRQVGHEPVELIDRNVLDLAHPDDRAVLAATLSEADLSPKAEYRMSTGSGDLVWVETARLPEPSRRDHIVLSSRVITDRKRLEHELRQHATHDALTGLANRELGLECLENALSRPGSTDVGLLFCDLDDFKAVNDRLGHEAGDRLLQAVAETLQRCLRPTDLLVRQGGDEFVVVLDGASGLPDVSRVASRLLSALQLPIDLFGTATRASLSIGGVVGRRGTTAVALLRAADAAMYQAKRGGGDRAVVLDAGLADPLDEVTTATAGPRDDDTLSRVLGSPTST